jgi:hypothetical protein
VQRDFEVHHPVSANIDVSQVRRINDSLNTRLHCMTLFHMATLSTERCFLLHPCTILQTSPFNGSRTPHSALDHHIHKRIHTLTPHSSHSTNAYPTYRAPLHGIYGGYDLALCSDVRVVVFVSWVRGRGTLGQDCAKRGCICNIRGGEAGIYVTACAGQGVGEG